MDGVTRTWWPHIYLCEIRREGEKRRKRHSWRFWSAAAAAAKSLQSCPTLCDPIDGSPPGSPVPGILQARTLEWVAISFSSAWKWKVKVKSLSRVWLLVTPWTAAYQAPPSMGFPRQECWSGVPLPSPISGLVTGKRGGDDDTFHCDDKWSIQFKAARLRGRNALPAILLEVWCPVHTGLKPKGTKFGTHQLNHKRKKEKQPPRMLRAGRIPKQTHTHWPILQRP